MSSVRDRGAPRPRGRHLLRSSRLADAIVLDAGIEDGDLVVDVGAGSGMLTSALVRAGARVRAVEPDPRLAARLRRACPAAVVFEGDAREGGWPDEPFRVVANLPFAHATEICRAQVGLDPRECTHARAGARDRRARSTAGPRRARLGGAVAGDVRLSAYRLPDDPSWETPLIAHLRGKLAGRTPDGLVLEVNGVGYLLAATPGAVRAAERGREAVVETYLHVREDALQLYGFADAGERQLFLHLLTVAGIGPKVALAIVSGAPAADLRRAIVLQDAARFQAVPGVGKKTAERIVLELKEKLGAEDAVPISSAIGTPVHVTARDALVELGWSVLEAEQALASVDPDLPPEERVRLALRRAA